MHTTHPILARLFELQEKPAPFTPGEALFWEDPHISVGMLQAHLDPDTDAASRRPETIDRSVRWLLDNLKLHAGDTLLDLGCGPGLYASRFARAGLQVTGVDFSRRSIEYASRYAVESGLDIRYLHQNYLELIDKQQYDAVVLIYGDFCPLNPEQRAMLLSNVRHALKPDGKFVLDVSTRELRQKYHNKNTWRVVESGFWRPGPHLLLEDALDFPELSIWLDQFVTIESDGKMSIYRNWFQDYTPETITAELSQNGFVVQSLWGDLAGQPLQPRSEWIGLITCKQ